MIKNFLSIVELIQKINESDELKIKLGQHLKFIREQLEMTQEELGKKIKLSRQSIIKYEWHPEQIKKGFTYTKLKKFFEIFIAEAGDNADLKNQISLQISLETILKSK